MPNLFQRILMKGNAVADEHARGRARWFGRVTDVAERHIRYVAGLPKLFYQTLENNTIDHAQDVHLLLQSMQPPPILLESDNV